MFEVVLQPSVERKLKKITEKERVKILLWLKKLANDPYSSGDIKKLSGIKSNAYRLRISQWRVVYVIITKDGVVEVVDIFMRREKSDYRNY